jgi:hypothetical protein
MILSFELGAMIPDELRIKPKLYYELPQQEFAANPIPKEKQFAVESTYPN